MPEEQAIGPATPEDVAILYSWANLPGAKYRDFSASRREYRAQQRARIADQQRETALTAAREMEEAANRDVYDAQQQVDEARRLEREAAADAEAQARAEDALRRAQERAEIERQEAHRHEQSAESLRHRAEAARQEMMEARKRAEDQAARYAEFDALYRAQVEAAPADTLPGELADPYYYTGQVDPAYFASTPGVRTAQAMRTSTERRAYIYPAHPGSEDFDSGSLQAYRPNTNFAPSPAQEQRPFAPSLDGERQPPAEAARPDRRRPERQYDAANDHYYDGGPSGRMFLPRRNASSNEDSSVPRDRDLHIRPGSQRASLEGFSGIPESLQTFAPTPRSRPAAQMVPIESQRRVQADRRSPVNFMTQDFPEREIVPRPSPVFTDRRRPPQDGLVPSPEPSIPVDEAYWRSIDRRSDGGRRRHDTPLDNRARTARHPRVPEPQTFEQASPEEDQEPAVPPAWLSSPDWPDAEDDLSQAMGGQSEAPLNAAPLTPVIASHRTASLPDRGIGRDIGRDKRKFAGGPPEAAYTPPREGVTSSPVLRSPTPPPSSAPAPSRAFPAQPTPPLLPAARIEQAGKRNEPKADERSVLKLANPPHRPKDSTSGQPTPAEMSDPGTGTRRERLRSAPKDPGPFSGEPVEVPADPGGLPRPDTLQQSRERVASRWFALKGLVGSQTGDRTDPARSAELQTPALIVLSLSGGVGKTSIVATLGRTLSALGEKVMLADTNTHGLLPYYFGARDLRPGSVRTFTPPPGSADAPVLLVNYEVEGLSADETAQDHLMDDVHRRAKATQRVLVDLSTSALWMARRLAIRSPWILVPVAPDMNSVLGTHTVERLFHDVTDAEGRPVKPFYVLNQFDRALPLHLDVREVLRQSLGDRLLPIMIHRTPAVSEALAEGMTVIDYAPGSPVTEDYSNLANWIRNLAAPGSNASRGVRWSER